MRLLLDTNVLVRWIVGRPIPRSVERILTRPDTERLVSIVTAWEIVMKTELEMSAVDTEAAIKDFNATVLPIKFTHLDEFHRLPHHEDHRDPFDRLLIAQALAEDVPVVTSDTRFSDYKRLRVLWD